MQMYIIKDPKVCDEPWYLCFEHAEEYEADHGHDELKVIPIPDSIYTNCEACNKQ